MKGKRCGFDGLLVQRGAGQGEEEMERSLGGPQAFGYIRRSSIHCEYKVTVSHHASKELIKRITSKIETPSEFYMVFLGEKPASQRRVNATGV